ncbi:hypothetical protein Tco_0017307 [Tanacetum coccineum]
MCASLIYQGTLSASKHFTFFADVPENLYATVLVFLSEGSCQICIEFLLANRSTWLMPVVLRDSFWISVKSEGVELITDIMLTEAIKQSKSYQMFIKYSTGQIPFKKSKGKGSQRKKIVDVSKESEPEPELIVVESVPEPTRKKKIRQSVFDTSSKMLQGVPSLTHERNNRHIGHYAGVPMCPQSSLLPSSEGTVDEEVTDASQRPDAEKSSEDAEINLLLEVQIQSEDPHIQSPSMLTVPVPKKDVFEHKKIDVFAKALAALKTQVPSVQIPELPKKQTPTVDLEQKSEKTPSDILKIKKEQAEKQKMPKFTISLQTRKTLIEYALKRLSTDYGHATSKEPVEEPIAEVVMDDVGDDVVHDDDQPHDDSKPKTSKTPNPEWFTQTSVLADQQLSHLGHLTVAADYFFNNDLEYLKYSDPKKTRDMVKRADRQFYKFKEGDFVDLHLNDIEDMLLLAVQRKLFHLIKRYMLDYTMALVCCRSLVIQEKCRGFTAWCRELPEETQHHSTSTEPLR